MIARVATFARDQTMLTASLTTQSRLNELYIQQASEQRSTDFGGLGSTSKRVVDLQVSVTRAQSYVDNTKVAKGRVELMYSVCDTMTDTLSDMRSRVVAATSATSGTGEDLKSAAQELFEDFASLLNTQYEGRYVFAGGQTGTVPVDLDDPDYAAATSPSTVDTAYYQGDDQVALVRVSDQQTVAYGVTGDDPAFEKALRALNLLSNITTDPLDQDTLDEANDLLVDALDAVLSVQSRLSLDAGQMEDAIANQEDYIDFAGSLVGDLTEVDVAQVAAELSSYEAQLEASYSAMAKIQGLKLWDFLR
jgi:flagellar hook-associated protein 3 FlgL